MTYPVYKPREEGRVIILGAGASYGSSIQRPPPLISNFISTGRDITRADYSRLWQYLDTVGHDQSSLDKGKPSVEELYSYLEIISQGLWHANEDEFWEDVGEEFWKFTPISFLTSFIVEVINPSSVSAIQNPCQYHDALASSLFLGDIIISFNYDLIADVSIKNNHKWSELGGYGFFCTDLLSDEFEDWIEHDFKSDVALLKPHGSINWGVDTRYLPDEERRFSTLSPENFHRRISGISPSQTINLTVIPIDSIKSKAFPGTTTRSLMEYYERTYTDPVELWSIKHVDKSPMNVGIIPPGRYKFKEPMIPTQMNMVWSNVRKSLILAREIVCIGYSFNPNDQEFHALFRLALSRNKNPDVRVLVVNPDHSITDTLDRLIPNVEVHHLCNTLKEYVESQL